jgi:hypothetical protein
MLKPPPCHRFTKEELHAYILLARANHAILHDGFRWYRTFVNQIFLAHPSNVSNPGWILSDVGPEPVTDLSVMHLPKEYETFQTIGLN